MLQVKSGKTFDGRRRNIYDICNIKKNYHATSKFCLKKFPIDDLTVSYVQLLAP